MFLGEKYLNNRKALPSEAYNSQLKGGKWKMCGVSERTMAAIGGCTLKETVYSPISF